jgi:hypothetical protein
VKQCSSLIVKQWPKEYDMFFGFHKVELAEVLMGSYFVLPLLELNFLQSYSLLTTIFYRTIDDSDVVDKSWMIVVRHVVEQEDARHWSSSWLAN